MPATTSDPSMSPDVVAAIDDIAIATTDAGLALCVIADTPEDAERWVARGARILLFNSTAIIGNAFRQSLREAKVPVAVS